MPPEGPRSNPELRSERASAACFDLDEAKWTIFQAHDVPVRTPVLVGKSVVAAVR
jgi:hypothetical protein